jgi:1-acyl-sn-glycerol-3-phosphate acyltransferase
MIHKLGGLALKLFFNRVSIQNRDKVPDKSPVIFVANHPNFFMDPLIVGSCCPRILHFFAKSTLFDSRLKEFILSKLNLIPIYRKIDDEENMGKNEDSFIKGYEILENNGAFLIFPEGISMGKRTLEKIKTGAARIGLEAESKNEFSLNASIIPIGISYSDLVRFRSDIMIRFGEPVYLKEFEQDYKVHETDTVKKLTGLIEDSLNRLTNYIQTDEIEDVVEGLELIYKMELMTELGMELDNKNDDFMTSKILTDVVQWYNENDPSLVDQFRDRLNKYMDLLKRLDIRDEFLDPARQERRNWGKTRTIIFLIVGSPLFIWGLVTNYLPYKIPRLLVEMNNKHSAEMASWKLIYGFIFFIVYYAIGMILFWELTTDMTLLTLFSLSLIPSGNFALYYSKSLVKYRQHLRFLSVFYKKRTIIFEIIKQRMELLQFIEDSKNRYLEVIR